MCLGAGGRRSSHVGTESHSLVEDSEQLNSSPGQTTGGFLELLCFQLPLGYYHPGYRLT